MESSCFDDGNATHIMIEVLPPEEEKIGRNEDTVTSLRPMEEDLASVPLLSSPPMACQSESAGFQRVTQNYQVVFKSSASSLQQKKSYKVYLKPIKSPGKRKNFQVIFKAFGSAEACKVAELGHKNTVVCCKSPEVGLDKKKLGEKPIVGCHSAMTYVEAKDKKNDSSLANTLPIQGLNRIQRLGRTAVSRLDISESTPLKLDLKDHALSWHSSPDLSRAIHESCRANKGASKLRTPRTLTRLMQQHRDNERYRHRGLNASINDITARLPKHSKKSDHETKIVKLKRIINYICHLENYIRGLCGELGLDLDFKQLFMTPNVKNLEVPKVDGGSCHSDDLDDRSDWMSDCEGEQSQLDIQEYKSETEDMIERISVAPLAGSCGQDELRTATHLIIEDGLDRTETGQEVAQEEVPEYTFLSYDHCDFSQMELEKELEELQEFIRRSSEAAAVDSIANDSCVIKDSSGDSTGRQRMDDVFRTIDVNILHSDFPAEGDKLSFTDRGKQHGRWGVRCAEAYDASTGMWQTNRDKLDHDFDENVRQSLFGEEFSPKRNNTKRALTVDFTGSNVTDENKLAVSKIKSSGSRRMSWMNGFMMYSHIHRQNYIRANIGLRNSHVTKLMASDWRKMNPAQQQPYRDQAKCYVESHLQILEASQPNY